MSALAHKNELTMSSREIAELTGSRHDKVKQSMERLADKGVISFTPVGENPSDQGGRPGTAFHVNQRDSYIVVAQIDAKFTARLVDRWMELEGLKKPRKLSLEAPFKVGRVAFQFFKTIGLDRNAAAIAANQATIKTTGVNLLALGGSTHLESESQQHWLTPSALGERINLSGRKVNVILEDLGLQEKVGGIWTATSKGKAHSRLFDTGKAHGNGTPVTQLKWSEAVLDMLGDEA